MKQAEKGDRVRIYYSGTVGDDTPLQHRPPNEPMDFVIGEMRVLPGLEKAVYGMKEGEKKHVTIPAQQAFGNYRNDLVVSVARAALPENIAPEKGKRLQISSRDGTKTNVTITAVTDDNVTLDANHQLAGRDIALDIDMVAIEEGAAGKKE